MKRKSNDTEFKEKRQRNGMRRGRQLQRGGTTIRYNQREENNDEYVVKITNKFDALEDEGMMEEKNILWERIQVRS